MYLSFLCLDYEFSISKKDKSEKEPDENDGALKTFLVSK
jgi:hypothetical protein